MMLPARSDSEVSRDQSSRVEKARTAWVPLRWWPPRGLAKALVLQQQRAKGPCAKDCTRQKCMRSSRTIPAVHLYSGSFA